MRGYERNAALAARYCGHVLLEKLSGRDLDALYAKLLTHGSQPKGPPRPLSRQSVAHVHRLLHGALRQAVKWRLIAHNPAADATPPNVPHKQARGFTIEEIAALLAAAEADPELYCMLALLLTTGLRRSELLGLTLEALDLEAATLTVERTVTEIGIRGGRARDHQDQAIAPHAGHPGRGGAAAARPESAGAGAGAGVGERVRAGPALPVPRQRWRAHAPVQPDGAAQPAAAPRRDQGRAAGARLAPRHRDPDDRRRCRREDHAEPGSATARR